MEGVRVLGYREDFLRANPGVKIPFKRGTYWRCAICGGWVCKSDLDVDHRLPKRKGGTDDLWNLQPTHKHCNRSKNKNQTKSETAETIVRATLNGDLDKVTKGFVRQKLRDALGIKYRR